MSTTFRPYAPDQMLLLPADLRAWLPEGHLAHHVSDLGDGVDLTAFYAPYAGDGRRNAPSAPRMMVKVLLYAYATGVFSARGIARKLEEDGAFRVLGAGNFPQHRTLCEFRRRHLSDFKELFVAVGRLARAWGLAATRAAKSRLEAQQRAADDARGRQPDQDRNPKGGPPYTRSYGEPDAKAQSNFTDPESGIMKTSNDGFQQCYNAQVAVDGAHQLVAATEVTANASDQGGVPALLDALAETVGEQPETVLADAGYSNERDLADLETRGIDGYVSLGREGKAARPRDPEKYPATSRMAEKLSRPAGRAA